jgi:hypothetical protein
LRRSRRSLRRAGSAADRQLRAACAKRSTGPSDERRRRGPLWLW